MAYLDGYLGGYDATTGQWTDARVPLTDAEKAAVQDELTHDPAGRGYRNPDNTLKSGDELAALMDGTYITPNPVTSAPLIPLSTVSKHDFGVFMGTMMGKVVMSGNSALISKWTSMSAALLPFVSLQDFVPVGSATIQGILAQLISDGIASQTDVEGFDKEPDPTWQADLVSPSRTSLVLTARPLVLDAQDFEGMN